MKLISEKKADSKHTTYTFSHRIQGTKSQLTETAINLERAKTRAWASVSEIYKELKKIKNEKTINA